MAAKYDDDDDDNEVRGRRYRRWTQTPHPARRWVRCQPGTARWPGDPSSPVDDGALTPRPHSSGRTALRCRRSRTSRRDSADTPTDSRRGSETTGIGMPSVCR